MLKEMSIPKKIPRVLLAHPEAGRDAIAGVQVLWPDRRYTDVLDLSLSGLVVEAGEQSSMLRTGQVLELRLKVPGHEDTLPFQMRLVQVKGSLAGFQFENMGLGNRLVLEQAQKDRIITESLKTQDPKFLPSQLRADVWLHGAFDTNVLVWYKSGSQEIDKALIEADNFIWMMDSGSVFLAKSAPTAEENQGYFPSEGLFGKSALKISMGASWMDRIIRLLDQVENLRSPGLSGLLLQLRSQRAH